MTKRIICRPFSRPNPAPAFDYPYYTKKIVRLRRDHAKAEKRTPYANPFHSHEFNCTDLEHFAFAFRPQSHRPYGTLRSAIFSPFHQSLLFQIQGKKNECIPTPVLTTVCQKKQNKTGQHLLMNCTLESLPNQTANASRPDQTRPDQPYPKEPWTISCI